MSALSHQQRAALEPRIIAALRSFVAQENSNLAAWPPSKWPFFDLVAALDQEFGWRENTLVVLVSDNGASGEGGPNGSVNEMKFANGIPDTVEEARKNPELGAGKGIDEIVEHYAPVIAALDARPVVVGHSFGGLIAQRGIP